MEVRGVAYSWSAWCWEGKPRVSWGNLNQKFPRLQLRGYRATTIWRDTLDNTLDKDKVEDSHGYLSSSKDNIEDNERYLFEIDCNW